MGRLHDERGLRGMDQAPQSWERAVVGRRHDKLAS